MTQNSLAVHAHFRCGLTKTIHSRVSRTTSATQRVPEQRLPAAVRAHSRSSLFHVTVELFIMPSNGAYNFHHPRCSSLTGPHFCACT